MVLATLLSCALLQVPAGAEPSGPQWVHRYPGSRSPADLREPFRDCVRRFLGALDEAQARVIIHSTFRPPERQYLMHWAWRVGREDYLASGRAVPEWPGLPIQWLWRDAQGQPSQADSVRAARQMIHGFSLRFRPATQSRHSQGRAIDMSIGWGGSLDLLDPDGQRQLLTEPPRNGDNPALQAVGASYGVFKLVTDPPHWSDDGH